MKYRHWESQTTFTVICSVWEYPEPLLKDQLFIYEGQEFYSCGDYPINTTIIFYKDDEEGRLFARSTEQFDEIMKNGTPRFTFVEGSE